MVGGVGKGLTLSHPQAGGEVEMKGKYSLNAAFCANEKSCEKVTEKNVNDRNGCQI